DPAAPESSTALAIQRSAPHCSPTPTPPSRSYSKQIPSAPHADRSSSKAQSSSLPSSSPRISAPPMPPVPASPSSPPLPRSPHPYSKLSVAHAAYRPDIHTEPDAPPPPASESRSRCKS